ncbi:hypothetical protein ScPMuIL_013907 [Solemya velum]
MEAIFHEKQEGSLCAQHCLNALLQGQYFSPVDLADIGRQLDEHERERMAEAGLNTEEYQNFGFFSIQVISNAVSVWGVELIPYNSQHEIAVAARQDPKQQRAFICNFREHWFTIRKLGNQWFNLNSLLSGPELVSDTYLSLLITQLQHEGYSIFISVGILPECEADQLLKLIPAVQTIKPRLINEKSPSKSTDKASQPDEEIQKAMEESKNLLDTDDAMLQKTLQQSMEGYLQEEISRIEKATSTDTDQEHCSCSYKTEINMNNEPSANSHPHENESAQNPTAEQLRLKRQAFLDRISKLAKGDECQEPSVAGEQNELTEEEMLQKALEMSMENQ